MAEYEFVLGFKALADIIPDIVGTPLEAEHYNEMGDSEQTTLLPNGENGLMVWRKVDNWTAFTDGWRTWVNGPNGVEQRLNTERFSWETEYMHLLPAPVIEVWTSPNHWDGRPYGDPIAVVIHTMAGTERGAESWLTNRVSQTSAHWGVNLEPTDDVDAFVDLGDRAWANGILENGNRWFEIYDGPVNGFTENPNNWTVSIETEDLGSPNTPVTDAQFDRTVHVGQLSVARYPTIKYLLAHRAISPRSRPNCPGKRWLASGKFDKLAQALELLPIM